MAMQSGDYIRMGDAGSPMRAIEMPVRLMPMPHWPGPKRCVELAVAGYPVMAVGMDCWDRSAISIEFIPEPRPDVPPDVVEALNGYPLLSIVCIDNGVGVKDINGIPTRVRENMAEQYCREIQKLLGEDRPIAVIGAGLNTSDTTRRYFWKIEA